MSEPVRARTRRRQTVNAELTRSHIVDTARELFLDEGYASTTIARIANDSGVVPQTVYNAVGSKAEVLKAVFESVVSGDEAPRSVPEVLRERVAGVPTIEGIVDVLAQWFVEVHSRTAQLWQVIADGAAHDPEIRRFSEYLAHRRLQSYVTTAEAITGLADSGDDTKRARSTRIRRHEDLAAVIWSIGHPQVFQTLVVEGGWSTTRYRNWVRATLLAVLGSPATVGPEDGSRMIER